MAAKKSQEHVLKIKAKLATAKAALKQEKTEFKIHLKT